jgi:MFS transporter, Spinster family, sphingosine-1-phosphate transporter
VKIRHRAAIVGLLTGLNLLNYLDRFVVNAVGLRVQDSFGLSDQQLGWVISAFMVGYFLTSPLFGLLGDRLPRKGLIAGGVLVWSLATFASGASGLAGAAGSFALLVAARVLVGVGEASYATLSPTIIDDLTESERKNRVLALFYAAIPVGSALGYALGGLLEHHFGWESAFYVAGAPGIVLAMLVLAIEEPPRRLAGAAAPMPQTPGRAPEGRSGVVSSIGELLATKGYRHAVGGAIAYTFALGALAAWAPKFLVARLDLTLHDADFWLGVILAATGFAGTAAGGFLGDRWPGGDRTRATLAVCSLSAAVAAPCAILALLSTTPLLAFVMIGLTEFFLFVSSAPFNAAVLGSVPSQLRASAMALSIFATHLFGDLVSPPAVGKLSDAIRAARAGSPALLDDHGASLRASMFTLPAMIALAAAWWGWGAWRPREKIEGTARDRSDRA